MGDHSPAGRRNNALALKRAPKPVAKFALAIQQIEFMGADDAAEPLVAPDPGDEAFTRRELFERRPDETKRIVKRHGRVHPGEPFAQIGAILIDQREHLGSVALFEQLQIDVFADLSPKHGSLYLSATADVTIEPRPSGAVSAGVFTPIRAGPPSRRH